ncbi:hypothetical protein DDW13_06750 [Acidianus hospitalis]|uniref:Uncharacterized protein n=1 Tax=Acidianus hospitalis TaxID=563177 RepID=A0A2T9X3E3_9CREN|nr:hypothetical protein DDW13_06750 [Acidianus hospitalis]
MVRESYEEELKDGKIQEILSVYGFPGTIENTFKGIYYHFEKVLKEDKSKKVELVAWALTSLYGYTPSASLDIPIEVTFNIIYQLLNLAEYGI